jgi:hypothetical protein
MGWGCRGAKRGDMLEVAGWWVSRGRSPPLLVVRLPLRQSVDRRHVP